MIDLKIVNTLDGGDLELSGNDLTMVAGVENTPYLAMFGGSDWVGNFLTDKPFNSRTEAVLNEVTLNSDGLMRITDAMNADLSYLSDITGTAWAATAAIIAPNKVRLSVTINGREFAYLWNPTELGEEKELVGLCPILTGLVSSEVTLYSITWSWDESEGIAYQYAYNTTGDTPTEWTEITDNYVVISALDSDTEYFFFVRSVCAVGVVSSPISDSATTVAENPLWISPWLDPSVTNPSPGTFMPYGLPPFVIRDADGLDIEIPYLILYTEAEEDAYLTYLETAPFPTLTGIFSRSSGAFSYALGIDEILISTPEVMYKYMISTQVVSDINPTKSIFRYSGSGSFTPIPTYRMLIDNGDGSAIDYITHADGGTYIQSHDYAATGGTLTMTMYIFHNDKVGKFTFKESGYTENPTSFTKNMVGNIPTVMKTLEISLCSNFDGQLLSLTGCTLLSGLNMSSNVLTSVASMFATSLPAMGNLNMANNLLDATAVDAFYNAFYTNSWAGNAMFISTSGNALPTAASLTARNAIIAAGGTIIT